MGKMTGNWDRFKTRTLDICFAPDFLITVSLIVILFYFSATFWTILAPFFTSFILAYLLNPMVRWWERILIRMGKRNPDKMKPETRANYRTGAVLLVFFKIMLLGMLFIVPFLLQLSTNVISMSNEIAAFNYKPVLKKTVTKLKEWKKKLLPDSAKSTFGEYLKESEAYLDQYQEKIEKILVQVNSWVGKFLKKLGNILLTVSNKAFKKTMDFMLIPILLFYLLLDFQKLYGLFLKAVPKGYRRWIGAFAEKTDETLQKFIVGQLTIAFLFGLMMSIGLWAIGIKFWLVIGPLSGIANLIPYLGIVFGLGPALLLAIYQGAILGGVLGALWMVVKVIILFSIIQTIDGFVFQPKIIGENVELHPLLVMLALFIGGEVMGIYGMIFAVPVAAILKVLVQELYNVLYEEHSLLLSEIQEGK